MESLTLDKMGGELLTHNRQTIKAVIDFGILRIYDSLMANLRRMPGGDVIDTLSEVNKAKLCVCQRVSAVKMAVFFYLNGYLIPREPEDWLHTQINPAFLGIATEEHRVPLLPDEKEIIFGIALMFALDIGLGRELLEAKDAPAEVVIQESIIRKRLETQNVN